MTANLATTNTPLPHLANIEAHLSPETWSKCIASMAELCQSADSEIVQVKAFDVLLKTLEVSEAAHVARQKEPRAQGGTLNLSADEVTVNVGGDELAAMRQSALEAHYSDELEGMVQRARDENEPNGSNENPS